MDASAIVSIVAVCLTTLGGIATGVWFAARLAGIVERLDKAVGRLETRLEAVDDKLDAHAQRLALLEAKRAK